MLLAFYFLEVWSVFIYIIDISVYDVQSRYASRWELIWEVRNYAASVLLAYNMQQVVISIILAR